MPVDKKVALLSSAHGLFETNLAERKSVRLRPEATVADPLPHTGRQ